MANSKVILPPSEWVIDEGGIVTIRYRVLTNDFNIRSAISPAYSIEVPDAEDIFTSITPAIASDSLSGNIANIRLSWSLVPAYDNIKFFVFVKRPSASSFEFYKSVSENGCIYVVDKSITANLGTYEFIVSLPTVNKKNIAEAQVFTKSITV